MKKNYFKKTLLFAFIFSSSFLLAQENQNVRILGKIAPQYLNTINAKVTVSNNLLAPSITPASQSMCSGGAITNITSSSPSINALSKLDCVTGGAATYITAANNGIYFDITNSGTVPLRISGFDIVTYASTTTTATINQGYTFYKTTTASTAVGNYNTAANWTNLGTMTYALPATALNSGYILTALLGDNGFTLAAGTSVGFYIVCNNTTTTDWKLGYRNTTTTGAPIADSNLTVTHRSRGDALFSGGTTLRGFYGNVYYHTGTYGFWSRNNTTNITGTTTAGDASSGASPFPISGNLTNTTATAQTTTYTITSYDVNGVKNIQTATVTVNVNPINTVTVAGSTLTADQAGATYQWFDCNNGNTPITGETNQSFTPSIDGNYGVTVTLNSCPVNSVCNTILNTTEFEANGLISIYPNPASNFFSINSKYDFKLTLINQLGQTIKHFDISAGQESKIQISDLQNGLYFLNGSSSEGKIISKKIIIQ